MASFDDAFVSLAQVGRGVGAADDYPATTATGARLAIGGALAGKLETAADVDWIAITVAGGSRYRFTVDTSGTQIAPVLAIYNASGELQLTNSGAADTSMLLANAGRSGTYFLAVSSSNNSTGG